MGSSVHVRVCMYVHMYTYVNCYFSYGNLPHPGIVHHHQLLSGLPSYCERPQQGPFPYHQGDPPSYCQVPTCTLYHHLQSRPPNANKDLEIHVLCHDNTVANQIPPIKSNTCSEDILGGHDTIICDQMGNQVVTVIDRVANKLDDPIGELCNDCIVDGHDIIVHDQIDQVDMLPNSTEVVEFLGNQVVDQVASKVDDPVGIVDDQNYLVHDQDHTDDHIDDQRDNAFGKEKVLISRCEQECDAPVYIDEILNSSFGEAIIKQLEDSDLSYLLDECSDEEDVGKELIVSIPLSLLHNEKGICDKSSLPAPLVDDLSGTNELVSDFDKQEADIIVELDKVCSDNAYVRVISHF